MAQPLAIVTGEAFDGRGINVTWENATAGMGGTAEVSFYVPPCIVILPTRREQDGSTASVLLVPGANRIRVTARDLDGNWAFDEIDLWFPPAPGGASVNIARTLPDYPRSDRTHVGGSCSGVVALELRNELPARRSPSTAIPATATGGSTSPT